MFFLFIAPEGIAGVEGGLIILGPILKGCSPCGVILTFIGVILYIAHGAQIIPPLFFIFVYFFVFMLILG